MQRKMIMFQKEHRINETDGLWICLPFQLQYHGIKRKKKKKKKKKNLHYVPKDWNLYIFN
jgi:hypothetical protein